LNLDKNLIVEHHSTKASTFLENYITRPHSF